MATATKRPPRSSPPPPPENAVSSSLLVRALWAIYRFLASLKLAVFSLASLAAVLAVGTFIERDYGTVAVQEWVYRSWWFAILLAFLATNILCAALIRFPWARRQTGFVITHSGLLIVLAGAFCSFQRADEGQVALEEGTKTNELVRPDHPVIRVREVDPHTQKPLVENGAFDQWPFRPGPLPWREGRYELVTQGTGPYKLAVKNHLPASWPRFIHEPAGGGFPMIAVALLVKPPGAVRATDMFASDSTDSQRWLEASNRAFHAAKQAGPAAITFQFFESEQKLDAFLHPPTDLGPDGTAILHYTDRAGKPRVETWKLDGDQKGKPRVLPESDLTVTFQDAAAMPLGAAEGAGALSADGALHYALFKVRKGESEEVSHFGWDSLPLLPSVLPASEHHGAGTGQELVHIDYTRPLSGSRLGLIEVAGLADGRLFYRSFNRTGLKGSGPLKLKEEVTALGGGDRAMSAVLRVDQYLTAGRRRLVYEEMNLDVGQLNNGIPAALVEMTCDGETREFWLRRSAGFDPNYHYVDFPSGREFEVAYDVDRKALGFEIALDDFDVGLDPGTSEPSSYRSDIRLTDESEQIKDKPITISMNNTMTHGGWTFYQSNYIPIKDPQTDEPTGRYMSVFQVGHDPGRPLKYLGSLLVVVGAFVQFYMRAGVFSDGGKRERLRAAAKAARRAQKEEHVPPAPEPPGTGEVL